MRDKLLASLTDSELLKCLIRLSENFTTKRESISQYLKDEKLISAYTYVYFQTNLGKLSFVLKQIPHSLRELIGQSDFLDIGSGPGTMIQDFIETYPEYGKKISGVDTSKLMLKQARKIFKDINFENKLNGQKGGTLLFSQSLNEMGENKGLEYINQVKPETIIILEPGTKDSFNLIKSFVSKLDGYKIYFPCLNKCFNCKMDKDDWCHQIIRKSYDVELTSMLQKAKINRNILPFCGFVLSKIDFDLKSDKLKVRIIRIPKETKFSLEWLVCLPNNDIKTLQLMKKSLKKKEIKELYKIPIGSTFYLEDVKEVGQFLRVTHL